MAGVHADTPNRYTTGQLPLRYTLNGSSAIAVGPFGRGGSPAVRFSGNADAYLELDCDGDRARVPSGATFILERDVRISSYPASGQRKMLIACLEGGAVQDGLYVEDDGTLSVARGEGGALTVLDTSAFVLPLDTDYRVGLEVLIHASAGTFDVQVQGPGDLAPVNVLAGTGEDTLETASATWDGYRVGSASPGVSTCQHWVVKDGSGGVHDTLHNAPQNVYTDLPNQDGAHSDWVRSTGLQQFATIDDPVADHDVTYNEGAAVNDMDVVGMAQAFDPNKPISFVVGEFVARNGGGSEEVAHVMREAGTDYSGASHLLDSSFRPYVEVYQESPDGNPWSPAVRAAIEGDGYERTA